MDQKTTKVLIIILILLILLMYFKFYGKYNTENRILQVYLDNITPNILMEKYPVLLYDKIVNPQDLISSLFYGLYNFQTDSVKWIGNPVLSSSKYTLLFNNSSMSYINIVSPINRAHFLWRKEAGEIISTSPLSEISVEFFTIKLKRNQLLVLPPYWIYQTAKKIKRIKLNDISSSIYEIYFKMRFKNQKKHLA